MNTNCNNANNLRASLFGLSLIGDNAFARDRGLASEPIWITLSRRVHGAELKEPVANSAENPLLLDIVLPLPKVTNEHNNCNEDTEEDIGIVELVEVATLFFGIL